jgi:hypothetical protein
LRPGSPPTAREGATTPELSYRTHSVRLIVAHKILITAALFLAAILLLRGIQLYRHTGSVSELVMGLAFGGVGVVLGAYLRYIWPK